MREGDAERGRNHVAITVYGPWPGVSSSSEEKMKSSSSELKIRLRAWGIDCYSDNEDGLVVWLWGKHCVLGFQGNIINPVTFSWPFTQIKAKPG